MSPLTMAHASLPRPRSTRRFARWLLALWLLALGCAGSAPLFDPIQPRLDCVTHRKAKPAESVAPQASKLWHCSQCLFAAPPPGFAAAPVPLQRVVRAEPQLPPADPRAADLSLTPPARAPPVFLTRA
ncbi:MAG: hypothetical protein J0L58_08075 [Burkholderiales bacterium]|uniref:hypothetical protein n=1 Tax=Inhella sp. TaxID=1921806 RepID=UPI001ACC8DBD|nr:hypothetical protein [Burkholderiales bacterium]